MCFIPKQNKTNKIEKERRQPYIRNEKYITTKSIDKGKQKNINGLNLKNFCEMDRFLEKSNLTIDTRRNKSLSSSVTIKEIESVIKKLKIQGPLGGAVG